MRAAGQLGTARASRRPDVLTNEIIPEERERERRQEQIAGLGHQVVDVNHPAGAAAAAAVAAAAAEGRSDRRLEEKSSLAMGQNRR